MPLLLVSPLYDKSSVVWFPCMVVALSTDNYYWN